VKMQRRNFLILGSLVGLSAYTRGETVLFEKKRVKEIEQTIRAVQEHLFPKGSHLPSARDMDVTSYLFHAINHSCYDKEIRAFVIEGAKVLQTREKGHFTLLCEAEKERALRSYEETDDGKRWLEHIMVLTMEGMFGDPIYGANREASGWKALHTKGGEPRPKSRYIEL